MITETVAVTAAHIKRGIPEDYEGCPIALALREMHPRAASIEVWGTFAWMEPADSAVIVSADLPGPALGFVQQFDDGEKVEPFEFELTWPDEAAVSAP